LKKGRFRQRKTVFFTDFTRRKVRNFLLFWHFSTALSTKTLVFVDKVALRGNCGDFSPFWGQLSTKGCLFYPLIPDYCPYFSVFFHLFMQENPRYTPFFE
jgi:hypothetical protein